MFVVAAVVEALQKRLWLEQRLPNLHYQFPLWGLLHFRCLEQSAIQRSWTLRMIQRVLCHRHFHCLCSFPLFRQLHLPRWCLLVAVQPSAGPA